MSRRVQLNADDYALWADAYELAVVALAASKGWRVKERKQASTGSRYIDLIKGEKTVPVRISTHWGNYYASSQLVPGRTHGPWAGLRRRLARDGGRIVDLGAGTMGPERWSL